MANDTKATGKEHTGVISITRKGIGFISTGTGGSDILVRPEDTKYALTGDMVAFVPAGFERGTPAGKVTDIIHRARQQFVGTLYQEDGVWLLRPDERKSFTPLQIVDGETKANHKAVVSFIEWKDGQKYPVGRVREIIGPAGDHETEMRSFVLRSGFELSFPPAVADMAKTLETTGQALMEKGIEGRKDMRKVPTVTIDPKDAKDFDDALSYRELPDGNIEVGIHIADVSYFVTPGSEIDKEAYRRATSIYLVDRTIPMLPEVLSNDLCSIRPNVDRLAMSAIFTMSKDGEILDTWFGETVIHSDKRFTYEEAQDILDKGDGIHLHELQEFSRIGRIIRKKRAQNGMVTFDAPEVKVEIDEKGVPVRILLKERKETNMLVEDLMLLANEKVAEYLTKAAKEDGTKSIYRIHDTPNPAKIEILAEFLKILGHKLERNPDGSVTGKQLNALFENIKGTPEEFLIKTTVVRSMAKAEYTTHNIGHFGLAMKHYTHFTSPIRRYPDLIIHRLMKAHITRKLFTSASLAMLEEDAKHASEREVAASEAERDSIKLKQVEFMARNMGKILTGTVTGVTDRGLFVADNETRSEGMVSVRNMGDDYYSYDEARYQLVGSKKGKTYRLGDTVKVELIKADTVERTLDFVLREDSPAK